MKKLALIALLLIACGPTPGECSEACYKTGQVLVYSSTSHGVCACGNPVQKQVFPPAVTQYPWPGPRPSSDVAPSSSK